MERPTLRTGSFGGGDANNPVGTATGARSDCPRAAGLECGREHGFSYALAPELLSSPVGVARRLAPIDQPDSRDGPPVDETRRTLLKYALVAGVVAAGAAGGATALHYLSPSPAGATAYPKVQLVFEDGSPVLASQYPYGPTDTELLVFNYPLTNEPNLLLNLGASAPNGVGPTGGLVAYSAICQHQGCLPPYISYYPAGACGSFYNGRAIIHCVCHGSTYDPATAGSAGGAALVTGPAIVPLPQTLLFWDTTTDYLFAVGVVGPPVFGHTNTLTGGSAVPSPTALGAPQTPTQQCPT